MSCELDLELVSARIKQRREELRMTLAELGSKVGLSRQAIHKYELGAVDTMPLSRLLMIAGALDISVTYLLGWDKLDAANPSKSEQEVITAYRSAPPEVRTVIDKILRD